MSKSEPLAPVYDHQRYEKNWYKDWMEKGHFHAPVDTKKDPFTILMPPPNVTSQLHMGHGLGYTIQDLMIRWRRMSGFNACWLPGTDHAGIATQMMVEKSLAATGEDRRTLGRDAFVRRTEEWRQKYGGMILEQFRQMGFSCDWDRLAYTMDEHLSKAVRHVFVELYNRGLIYRGERLVNWDTVLLTAVSDDEVENKEVQGNLWYFRYPIDGTNEYIAIATTRPETMLGDTAVCVHPDDERFKHLIGKQVRLPFTDRLIPILGDDYVKSEFGTGAVKITPAHDPNDFEIGKRHSLAMLNVMNEDGTMNDACPERFRGMDRFEARKEIIKGLKELDLFDETKSYKTSIPHSERSKSIIEPRLSMQWYVKMDNMAKTAADAARDGRVRFYPDNWKKTYLYWLDNIQDWCISRQLWWGHRIPIWHCQSCQSFNTGMEDPTECSSCGSKNLKQDEDVLDTWFSSWLWPLSPFGWPEPSEEKRQGLDYFYPSDVLVTAPEIIFLWVARMIMVGLEFKGEVPFKDIYFNATVCDKQGRKFSKTLGNGIDPLEVISKHGADAVRYTAVSLAPLGGRVRMATEDFETGAKFVNKIWNAARLLIKNIPSDANVKSLNDVQLTRDMKWLLHQLNQVAEKVHTNLERYRVNEAIEDIYHFVWDDVCDWALETSKPALDSSSGEAFESAASVLVYTFDQFLRLAHPVMPFVTEELWQRLPKHPDLDRPDSICVAKYPRRVERHIYDAPFAEWQEVQGLISGIRSVRSQAGVPPKEKLSTDIVCNDQIRNLFEGEQPTISRLANLKDIRFIDKEKRPAKSLVVVDRNFEAYVPVADFMDVEKEVARLRSEVDRLSKIEIGLSKKLSNDNFVARAPEDVVAQTREQQQNIAGQLESLKLNLSSLTGA